LTFAWTDETGQVVGTTPVVALHLAPGAYTFRLTVRDGKGGTGTAAVTVTVRDTTPPRLRVSLSPSVVWPPNHKFVPVTAIVDAGDACGPPEVTLLSIIGEGAPDDIRGAVFGTDDRSFLLRAERGRVYVVTYRARDAAGHETTARAEVRVIHDGR
jgi:hypothetical protein